MVVEEKFDKKTIEQIDAEIKRCVKGANKIENGNYILAMLLNDMRQGKVTNIVEVAEWCFEKIKIGREVDYVLTKLENSDKMISEEKEKINE